MDPLKCAVRCKLRLSHLKSVTSETQACALAAGRTKGPGHHVTSDRSPRRQLLQKTCFSAKGLPLTVYGPVHRIKDVTKQSS